jgi:hypothetical protein
MSVHRFLRCMSMLFHTVLVTLVSLVVFSSTVSIFPFAPGFYLFYLSPPYPGSPVPFPVPFDFVGLLFNHLFVFFSSLSVTNYFLILVVSLPMLYLVPCPVFVWGPLGLLATGSCYWVG